VELIFELGIVPYTIIAEISM